MVESCELETHATLIAEEVAFLRVLRSAKQTARGSKREITYHAIHEVDETPKGYCIILHDCIDGSEQVTHALDIAQVLVVFIVG